LTDTVTVPRPSLRRMWRIWSVYGVSSLLNRSIAFLLLPLYTRVLTPQEYGIRAMVALCVDVLGLLFAFGLKEAINRFYTSGDGHRRPWPEAASTGIIAHAFFRAVGVAGGLVWAPWLAGVLLGDSSLAPYLRLGLVAAFFMHTQEGAFIYFRARGRAGMLALASLCTLLGLVALNLLFVVGLRQGVAGMFYAEIVVFGVSGLLFTAQALREVGVTFSSGLVRRMIGFGAPMLFIPLSWIFLTRIDAMFLTHYGSLAYVGVYAMSVQCAQVLQFTLVAPFQQFWDPTQFEIAADPSGSRTFRRMFQWFTFTAVVAAFGCAIAASDVIRVMTGPAFHGAADVVPLLLVTYVLLGIQMFFNSALLISGRTRLIAGIAVLTAVVNVGANALLVPSFLAAGAAAARVVAMTLMVVMTYVVAQRLWPQRPDFVALAKVSGWAIALFVASRWLPEMSLALAVVVKGLLVVALVGLSVWSGAVERADLVHGWSVLRDRRRPRPLAEAA
jgi:O-antigen/teichoic acid export membrane protein